MAVQYVVVEKRNSFESDAQTKFYGLAKSSGETSIRKLAKRIAKISTVSSIDTMAVLEALLEVIPEELTEGNIVRLGDFGSFHAKIKSDGSETRDDFNSSLIQKTKIVFKPGKIVKNVLNDVEYKKAEG